MTNKQLDKETILRIEKEAIEHSQSFNPREGELFDVDQLRLYAKKDYNKGAQSEALRCLSEIEKLKEENEKWKEESQPFVAFNKIDDLRVFLLHHPDSEMVKSSCLHYLGDAYQNFNVKLQSLESQNIELMEALKLYHSKTDWIRNNKKWQSKINSLLKSLPNKEA